MFRIGERPLGGDRPVYIVAELSANHRQSREEAIRLVEAAKECGADAIKLQTYTPDTLTLQSDREWFRVSGGTLWDGHTLYDLYSEAYMPWEWQAEIQQRARTLGMDFFSTAFDPTAVAFLNELNVPVHKVASCELVDTPLIECMARTGKPLILSTGMATLGEIEAAVEAARRAGASQICLLKCTADYPALPEEMNLRTIRHLSETFQVPVGLSDHTLGIAIPVAAVAVGAVLIEKHFTLSRDVPGPDSAFSLEPAEFRAMVEAVRVAEEALGGVRYGPSAHEAKILAYRRSLFVVKDMKFGDPFTEKNVRSIRPAAGLAPSNLGAVLGRAAAQDISRGTPLTWDLVS